MSDAKERPKRRRRVFWLVNTLLPLLFGLFIYILYRPDTYISSVFLRILNTSGIPSEQLSARSAFLRFYLCDILWAYALTFTISFLLGQLKKELFLTAAICVAFEGMIEFMQKWQIIRGTFDWIDLLSEALATMFAISMIIYFTIKQRRKT